MAIEGFADLDFERFHRQELPDRAAGEWGLAAARAAQPHGSLAFRPPDGSAFTYRPEPGGIALAPGDADADTVVALEVEAWEGLVHDYESAPGLLYGGRVRCLRGDAMDFVGWEPALRALYAGRPVYEPDKLSLHDRAGRPLDPQRAFAPGDDEEEMAHFLDQTGYLFVRGLFSGEEARGFLAEAMELRREARPGDKLSWWATGDDGEPLCCRVTRAADKPRLGTLRDEPRLRGLADLARQPLVASRGEGNGVTVIFKTPGVSEGLSDLPWHRDCGMGGHALMCPVLIASVFLSPATPETGELRFLPGSWRCGVGFMQAGDATAPRSVGFTARPGDVSVHYGDVMHAAPPPAATGLPAYRVSATVGFSRPGARNHRGESSYNAVLHQREDGQIESLTQVARRG